jgi:hypothetical protein
MSANYMNGPLCSSGIIFAKRMFEKFALAPQIQTAESERSL